MLEYINELTKVFLCVGIYGMASLCYFLINSLKIRVQSASSAAHGQYQPGDRRRNVFIPNIAIQYWTLILKLALAKACSSVEHVLRHYITLGISLVQPLLFYIITRNVAPGN